MANDFNVYQQCLADTLDGLKLGPGKLVMVHTGTHVHYAFEGLDHAQLSELVTELQFALEDLIKLN